MMKILVFSMALLFQNVIMAQPIQHPAEKNNWDADSLGNHRVALEFFGKGAYAKTIVEWRRNDDNPSEKRLIIEDGQTHQKINNYKTGVFNHEKLELYFEPVSGKGNYYLYYMPYKNAGRANYPQSVYLKPEQTAAGAWLKALPKNLTTNTRVLALEAIDPFNSYDPMEVVATDQETEALARRSANKAYLVFSEDRAYPIRMGNKLPARWLSKKHQAGFRGQAHPGEYYSYQLGIWALKDLERLSIVFSDLKATGGAVIGAESFSCLNTNGADYKGQGFSKQISIGKGSVQALWCLAQIPPTTPAGLYQGTAKIEVKNAATVRVPITIQVDKPISIDGGIAEPEKQTRLHWLNSTLAQQNNVVAPYAPLQLNGEVISLSGRTFQIDKTGLPAQIQTFFTEEMTGLKPEPNLLLTEPIHFHFTGKDGKDLVFKNGANRFTEQSEGTIAWQNTLLQESLKIEVQASLEFDGYVAYQVKATALRDVEFKNISLHIPFVPGAAQYIMGLGLKGQKRPEHVNWKWEVAHKNQEGAWMGAVNAGLQYALRDENYVRPLNTNFYLQKPLLLPRSWGNGNKGGIDIAVKGKSVLANNYTGERSMKEGEVLYFNFNLLITPFHTLNTDFQWAIRFYHKYDRLETVKEKGATVINIHHATPINPWINYPFIEYRKLKSYIDSAHHLGLKVKIYNTVRELSNRAYETFPMRSLGSEIYSPGPGGGFSWLQEHLGKNYIPAWFVPEIKDAAIVNSGMSRWHNYYVEGLDWLTKNVGIDGIYLDDVAFDRITMKRIKRVLTADGRPGIIDLHSANQYNKNDGFINSAMLYMEHFPYLNRLWFGEYFDYENNGPDFFLTEVSGIPFGLMGEMLEKGGNPWRGMVYGMTNRLPWTENADPSGLWKLWDDFGMQGTQMIGYWVSNAPVQTGREDLKATVYKKAGKSLIALASWAVEDVEVGLHIDWERLGIDASKAKLVAPYIKNFQEAREFKPNDKIPVEKGKGWLLILE